MREDRPRTEAGVAGAFLSVHAAWMFGRVIRGDLDLRLRSLRAQIACIKARGRTTWSAISPPSAHLAPPSHFSPAPRSRVRVLGPSCSVAVSISLSSAPPSPTPTSRLTCLSTRASLPEPPFLSLYIPLTCTQTSSHCLPKPVFPRPLNPIRPPAMPHMLSTPHVTPFIFGYPGKYEEPQDNGREYLRCCPDRHSSRPQSSARISSTFPMPASTCPKSTSSATPPSRSSTRTPSDTKVSAPHTPPMCLP